MLDYIIHSLDGRIKKLLRILGIGWGFSHLTVMSSEKIKNGRPAS
jgi:hypothetical protein